MKNWFLVATACAASACVPAPKAGNAPYTLSTDYDALRAEVPLQNTSHRAQYSKFSTDPA